MPNYKHYRESISNELICTKDRVKDFINHNSEDGKYKEIILKNVLRRHLPHTVSIGTGFVMNEYNEATKQIDIIIYDNKFPPLFQIDDFVIVVKESVIGIIEVKTTIRKNEFERIYPKAHENGQLIIGNSSRSIFNGIFGYESDLNKTDTIISESISQPLKENIGQVNNICFGKDIFMKAWYNEPKNCYKFYNIHNLSFGYFISNLLETVFININQNGAYVFPGIIGTSVFNNYLYPLNEEGGKENYLIKNWTVSID